MNDSNKNNTLFLNQKVYYMNNIKAYLQNKKNDIFQNHSSGITVTKTLTYAISSGVIEAFSISVEFPQKSKEQTSKVSIANQVDSWHALNISQSPEL